MICYVLTRGFHELIPPGGPYRTHVPNLPIHPSMLDCMYLYMYNTYIYVYMLCYVLTWGVHELIPPGGPEGAHVPNLEASRGEGIVVDLWGASGSRGDD